MKIIDNSSRAFNLQEGINIKPPKAITNLENVITYIQISQKKYLADYNSKGKINTEIRNYLVRTYGIIDTIMEVAEELGSEDKKQAFYELMENNHIIMAGVYKIRNKFFNFAINVLCEKAGLPELDDKMTSEDAMIKLCELAESKNCSRLQRALDILVKHGDNLTIVDKDGEEQSNASNLKLTNDDIYSLQLLTKTNKWGATAFSEFLVCSVYGSIFGEAPCSTNNFLNYSIYNLYNIVFVMAVEGDDTNTDIEAYKKKNISKIKKYLNDLKNKNRLNIRSIIRPSVIYNDIKHYKNWSDIKFKTNVIKNYISPIKSLVSIIRGESSRTTNEEAQTSNSASSSLHEQKNNEIIQDVINTSNLKEEDITSLSVASSSSTPSDEQPIADFLNNNNLSIILITIAISIIILSIFGLYQNEIKPLMNN
ncbi:hypothetical protein NEPAR06_0467 [Nematocida parisii]|uniref:Uncharacterized protein n=1 Tax=Nematocida parisii (strain ERTm3) TaxID=935791 RepID=I3EJJ0_NEMP3|nr:uncharacterized protein NEPG_01083 [Nematocida parisii ERTm1]EIJ89387.1 hypothetical protein NEQG_00157 [Nematocida parisii ERTm3]KAI5142614.1 hypothetical protein NEPAR07_0219 [Nematocida parisii]EIJ94415.1 hypothetical protein NEPG_01083 [Nematocida parisii ERTm1]KAI5153467.1 hypothetical protein NEPAR06_0467 [Nematocida parisii]KAI5158930.1 hypothetical protein NEPAR05_2277 [Nematocida parisii]|eukprot:XP_013058911.1 hypothetical protein NEPG_01083 [Nematocida parisii ERTm1]